MAAYFTDCIPGQHVRRLPRRVSAEFLGRIFATMALTPQHTYQVWTKRPKRMRDLLTDRRVQGAMQDALLDIQSHGRSPPDWAIRLLFARTAQCPWPLPNVWLGTSRARSAKVWPVRWCNSQDRTSALIRFRACLLIAGKNALNCCPCLFRAARCRNSYPGR